MNKIKSVILFRYPSKISSRNLFGKNYNRRRCDEVSDTSTTTFAT